MFSVSFKGPDSSACPITRKIVKHRHGAWAMFDPAIIVGIIVWVNFTQMPGTLRWGYHTPGFGGKCELLAAGHRPIPDARCSFAGDPHCKFHRLYHLPFGTIIVGQVADANRAELNFAARGSNSKTTLTRVTISGQPNYVMAWHCLSCTTTLGWAGPNLDPLIRRGGGPWAKPLQKYGGAKGHWTRFLPVAAVLPFWEFYGL